MVGRGDQWQTSNQPAASPNKGVALLQLGRISLLRIEGVLSLTPSSDISFMRPNTYSTNGLVLPAIALMLLVDVKIELQALMMRDAPAAELEELDLVSSIFSNPSCAGWGPIIGGGIDSSDPNHRVLLLVFISMRSPQTPLVLVVGALYFSTGGK